MFKAIPEKLQRTTDDIFVVISDEEERFRQKYVQCNTDYTEERKCTICSIVTTDKAFPHPALKVVICFNCLLKYDSTVFLVSKDGNDINCRWCAEPAQKYCCVECTCVFCKSCLERNFGSAFVSNIDKDTEWQCLICEPKLLWRLRAACTKVMETAGITSESSAINSTTETSGSAVDNTANDVSNERLNRSILDKKIVYEDNIASEEKEADDSCMSLRPIKADPEDESSTVTNESGETNLSNNINSFLHPRRNQSSFSMKEDQLSVAAEEAHEELRNILKKISYFIKLLILRTNQFDTQIIQRKNFRSYKNIVEAFEKISVFCDNAIKNINGINKDIKNDFAIWFQTYEDSNADTNVLQTLETIKIEDAIANGLGTSAQDNNPNSSNQNKKEHSNRRIKRRCSSSDKILEETLADVKSNSLSLSTDRKYSKKFNLSLTQNIENDTRSSEDSSSHTVSANTAAVEVNVTAEENAINDNSSNEDSFSDMDSTSSAIEKVTVTTDENKSIKYNKSNKDSSSHMDSTNSEDIKEIVTTDDKTMNYNRSNENSSSNVDPTNSGDVKETAITDDKTISPIRSNEDSSSYMDPTNSADMKETATTDDKAINNIRSKEDTTNSAEIKETVTIDENKTTNSRSNEDIFLHMDSANCANIKETAITDDKTISKVRSNEDSSSQTDSTNSTDIKETISTDSKTLTYIKSNEDSSSSMDSTYSAVIKETVTTVDKTISHIRSDEDSSSYMDPTISADMKGTLTTDDKATSCIRSNEDNSSHMDSINSADIKETLTTNDKTINYTRSNEDSSSDMNSTNSMDIKEMITTDDKTINYIRNNEDSSSHMDSTHSADIKETVTIDENKTESNEDSSSLTDYKINANIKETITSSEIKILNNKIKNEVDICKSAGLENENVSVFNNYGDVLSDLMNNINLRIKCEDSDSCDSAVTVRLDMDVTNNVEHIEDAEDNATTNEEHNVTDIQITDYTSTNDNQVNDTLADNVPDYIKTEDNDSNDSNATIILNKELLNCTEKNSNIEERSFNIFVELQKSITQECSDESNNKSVDIEVNNSTTKKQDTETSEYNCVDSENTENIENVLDNIEDVTEENDKSNEIGSNEQNDTNTINENSTSLTEQSHTTINNLLNSNTVEEANKTSEDVDSDGVNIKKEIDESSVFSDDTQILDDTFLNNATEINANPTPSDASFESIDKSTPGDYEPLDIDNTIPESLRIDDIDGSQKNEFMTNIGLQSVSESGNNSDDEMSIESWNDRIEEAYLQLCADSSDYSFTGSEDSSDEDSMEDVSDNVELLDTSKFNNDAVEQKINNQIDNLHFTDSDNSSLHEANTEEDIISVKILEDPKLIQCFVQLDRMNLTRQRVSSEDREEREINRLTNLESLKRAARTRLSSDSSVDSQQKRKKRRKVNTRIISDSSDSDSDISDKLSDDSSWKCSPSPSKSNNIDSDSDSIIMRIDSHDEDMIENEPKPNEDDNEINVSDNDNNKANLSDDDCVVCEDVLKSDKEEEKENDEITAIELSDTDVKDIEEADTKEEKKAKSRNWRQDRLLRESLQLSDSDDTDSSVANAIIKKHKERNLQNTESKVNRRIEEETDGITVIESDSTDSSDSDSDCQVICVDGENKKKLTDSDDEDTKDRVKKGRRNIKKVMSDELLEEETKKADKEEALRKERIEMKHKSLENALSQSQLSEEQVGLILDVNEATMEPLVSVHPRLVSFLKPHQCSGIKFMWDVCFESVKQYRKDKGAGCILAHCMGLGKTLQVVVLSHALLTSANMNIKHILIVVPLSTLFNWKKEFTSRLEENGQPIGKHINVFGITADKNRHFYKKLTEIRLWKSNGGVLLIGYESFQQLAFHSKGEKHTDTSNLLFEALVNPGPDVIVCDEGHMLKNGKTCRFKKLSQVKTMRRIILTGTPLQNNLTEYYYMVSFVKPHLLGTYKEYTNRFMNPIQNGQYVDSGPQDIALMRKRSHVLHKKLETTIQRYEVSELKQYLPEKLDYVLLVHLSDVQIALYRRYLEYVTGSTEKKPKKLFTNFHNLQNIWTHPALLQKKIEKSRTEQKKEKTYEEDVVCGLDPDDVKDNILKSGWLQGYCPDDVMTNIEYGPKMQILLSIVKECEAIGDKLLVFSSVRAELDIIEYFLKTYGSTSQSWIKNIDYFRMDGTSPVEARTKYCNIFNDENNKRARVFLLSHKVGGLGLNLMAANRVVLMDVSWNPAYDSQSVFRIYRFGQVKKCYIYRLVSMGTMEEIVYGRSITKLATAGRVVDEQQIHRHFNSDELQRMYRLICDFDKERPTPTLPGDRLLAKLLELYNPTIYKYHEHQSLLENVVDEKLNEEEMKLAWEELRKEEEEERRRALPAPVVVPPVSANYSGIQNSMRQVYIPKFQNNNATNASRMQNVAVPSSSNTFNQPLNTPGIMQVNIPTTNAYSLAPNRTYNALPVSNTSTTPLYSNIQYQGHNLSDLRNVAPQIVAQTEARDTNRATVIQVANNMGPRSENTDVNVNSVTSIPQTLTNAIQYNYDIYTRNIAEPSPDEPEYLLPDANPIEDITTDNHVTFPSPNATNIPQEGNTSMVANSLKKNNLESLLLRTASANPSLKILRRPSKE